MNFRRILLIPAGIVLLGLSVLIGFFVSLQGRIYQNIYISSIDIGKLTPEEAKIKLADGFKSTENNITVLYEQKEFGVAEVGEVSRDFKWAVDQAYSVGRSGNLFLDAKVKIITQHKYIYIYKLKYRYTINKIK